MRRLCIQSFANLVSVCIVRSLLTLSIATVFSSVITAQDIQYTKDSVDQNKRSSVIVDPSSLGLNLQIPIGGYAGRGDANLPVALQYSSKVWHLEYGGNAGMNPHAQGWVYPVFEDRGG